ncbi:MAG: ATP-binding cassette domain-containing protein [Planctomycetes bacterium]|nr:ATP-binding cassette domain-containing protein [Planctomycetota bacterium]
MIDVDNVTKRYGPTLAVDAVSFHIGAGEIVGFLGPNGAGKSTLLKMISTWMEPDSGSIRIAGHDTRTAALSVRRALGYLPEHNALYDGMRVERFLEFVGRARGLSGATLRERMAWCIQGCRLEAVVHKRVQQCSKGYRQRIGVAASLIHDPPVIVLDEPTHGLDPIQVVAFRNFIQGLRKNRAILFSSHILSEVVGISERLLIIQHGRLLADVKVEELRRQAAARGEELENVVLEIVRRKAPARDEVSA